MLGSCRWENMCHAFHAFALADVTAFQRVPGDLVGWFGTQVAGWWKPFSDRCRSRNADCKGGIVRCHSSPTNRRKKDLTREWQRRRTRRKEMWNSPCVDCASRNSMTLQTLWHYETLHFHQAMICEIACFGFLGPCWPPLASWLGLLGELPGEVTALEEELLLVQEERDAFQAQVPKVPKVHSSSVRKMKNKMICRTELNIKMIYE